MSTKKITKLTAEQEARLVEFRDEWMKIGLSSPTDRLWFQASGPVS